MNRNAVLTRLLSMQLDNGEDGYLLDEFQYANICIIIDLFLKKDVVNLSQWLLQMPINSPSPLTNIIWKEGNKIRQELQNF